MTEKELIKRCAKKERSAQRMLYEQFAPKMMGVCKRYLRQKEVAEEVLINGFLKVYQHIKSYKGKGSFEGWIRKIMVNEALMQIRKRTNFNMMVEYNEKMVLHNTQAEQKMEEKDILKLLNYIPAGCRAVFNLYVMEGFKHHEIAQKLGISDSTSKSQLALAKKKLRQLIVQYGITTSEKKASDGR